MPESKGLIRFSNLLREGRISFLFLTVAVFLLPIWRNLFIISLWPWLFFWFLEIIVRKPNPGKLIGKLKIKPNFLPLLFIFFAISLTWTVNLTQGFNQLGRSVLLLIIPLVVTLDVRIFDRTNGLRTLLKSYILGVSVALSLLVVFAIVYSFSFENGNLLYNPRVDDWEHAFFYSAFSFLIHPTYFGMMVLMAAGICVMEVKPLFAGRSVAWWPGFLGIIFFGSLFLISSRAMMLAAVIVLIWFLFNSLKSARKLFLWISLVIIVLASITFVHPRSRRVQDSLPGEQKLPTYEQMLQLSGRGNIWSVSLEIIRDNAVLGVGLGDANDELNKRYLQRGYQDESIRRLNCHNQFLETWVTTGVFGILILMFILFYPLFHMEKSKRYLYGSFLIVILTGFTFESVLNRIWGVAFFSLFYTLLTQYQKPESYFFETR